MKTKLELISERARREGKCRFTSLSHLLNESFLAKCYKELKRKKAPGVDGVSVEEYGKELENNLQVLVKRMKGMKYYPQPVRRVYIPKGNGKLRPLGIPAVEDKVVQMGISKILEAIFENDFLDVSYGFRPGRSCHDALKAFDRAVMRKPVSYVIEVDIRGYYDHIDHQWLMTCLKQRISDTSLLGLIWRNLKAGVFEEGRTIKTEKGAPQGGIMSPILSNIYLHYILDLWFEKKLKKSLKGHAELIRYADDFVICCQYKREAHSILKELKDRLAKFGLEIAEEKTRVEKFGRFAKADAIKEGKKPATIELLGFTHFCSTSRNGKFIVGRRTSGKRFRNQLKEINEWLRKIRNACPLIDWWRVLRSKLTGYYQYFGVSGNYRSISNYYDKVLHIIYKWWNRRSQKRSGNWIKFQSLLGLYPLPKPRIVCSLW